MSSGGAAASETDARRRGAAIGLRDLNKTYGGSTAIADINLDIAAGEFVTLLGPSGSGKTTTLMAIAGFVDDLGGHIFFDGRDVTRVPPHRRDVGVVFQHLALFPHLDVAANIAYPLRMRGVPAAEIGARVKSALALVKMSGFEARMPHEMSGGQQQRVAIARAIVFEPKIMLLDEPLAALDKKLREDVQQELRSLHRHLGITMVHVTHDQSEALAMSDRVVVINHGRIEHVAPPRELYDRPQTRFAASFIGDADFIQGRTMTGGCVLTAGGLTCRVGATPEPTGRSVVLMLRPERVRLGEAAARADNLFDGVIADIVFRGDRLLYTISLNPDDTVLALAANVGQADAGRIGDRVTVGWNSADARLFIADDAERFPPNTL